MTELRVVTRPAACHPARSPGIGTQTHTHTHTYIYGVRGSTVVKALCYKSEGRWFDPRWCHWKYFIDTKSFRSHGTMTLGSTQPLTEMSTRKISWGKGGRCIKLTTLPTSCAVFMKSGNINFLESSRPAFFKLFSSGDHFY